MSDLLYSWISQHSLLVAGLTLAAIAITTLLYSLKPASSESEQARCPPIVPYWLPVIGHIPNILWGATAFLRSLRAIYKDGAFSLNIDGSVHTVVYAPSLVTALLDTEESKVSHDQVGNIITERVFGFPMRKEGKTLRAAHDELRACFHHLLHDEKLAEMVQRTTNTTKETVVNLVSFSRSPVDQSYWERTAKAQLVKDNDGREVVAANLMNLIRDYCAVVAVPTVMGSDLLDNYPDLLEDLWTVDRAFLYLAAGLPRWIPIPLVTRAHLARRRILQAYADFEQALDHYVAGQDPGQKWHNLDDVGNMIKERVHVYRKHNLSMEGRAACELGLTWAMNANSNMLVFWMLNRIYADKKLLSSIRAEIAPHVQAVQPKQTLAVAEAPRLQKLDVDGLCSECPLLKSCYVECLRVDAATWSFRVAKEDFQIVPRDNTAKAYLIKAGQYIHAAHDLHNSDPAYFRDPEEFRADRHIQEDDQGRITVDLSTIRPYRGGSSMCKGRFFAYKECMLFVAAILVVWDMEVAGGGKWKFPLPRKAIGVFTTADPTPVWLRRRELPIV